jgi:FkbM family methyltransferase
MINRIALLLIKVPPLYRLLQKLYVATFLRARGSQRYSRERIWTALSQLSRVSKQYGLTDGFLSAQGNFYLQMPDGILLYYNFDDRDKTMGDGQSLDLAPVNDTDPIWIAIQQLMKPGKNFIDVGANNGYFYALRVAKLHPKSQVIAFEPNPRISFHLKHNVEINKFANIDVAEKALGQAAGSIFLGARLGASAYTSSSRPGADWIEVPVITLDSFLDKNGRQQIGLIKVDIEGGEYDFLLGCKTVMEEHRAIFILEHKQKWLARAGVSTSDILDLAEKFAYEIQKFKGQEDIILYPKVARKKIQSISHLLVDLE